MEELDLMQIVKCAYKRKNILAYILLICITVGSIYTFAIKGATYDTDAKILIDKADATISDFIMSTDLLENEDIKATFDKTTKLITIKTSTRSAEKTFRETEEYIIQLEEKIKEKYEIEKFDIIENVKYPEKANNTYVKDMAISLGIGLILYLVYVFGLIMKQGITNAVELENTLKVNVLGEIKLEENKKKSDLYNTENEKIINELKRIESKIEFNKDNKKPKTILFTGTKKGSGTTYIVNNLASQYAKIYNKVLLVDTDILKGKLTEIYNLQEEKGLTNMLEKDKENAEKLVKKTDKENISILPIGNASIEEDIFLKEKIAEIIKKLAEKYDIILIDTLSVNEHIIPIQLTSVVDATVITMESGKTKFDELLNSKNTIERVDGKISGIIMNKKC